MNTFTHEHCHAIIDKIFENDADPFKGGDIARQEKMQSLAESVFKLLYEKRGLSGEYQDLMNRDFEDMGQRLKFIEEIATAESRKKMDAEYGLLNYKMQALCGEIFAFYMGVDWRKVLSHLPIGKMYC